jgi:hypothetical protein
MAMLGGPAEAAAFGNGTDIAQLVKFHLFPFTIWYSDAGRPGFAVTTIRKRRFGTLNELCSDNYINSSLNVTM